MATPVFCCGAECGVNNVHWGLSGTASFSTGTIRSGLRSLRVNPTAAVGAWFFAPSGVFTRTLVFRFYINFASLPTSDSAIMFANTTESAGVYFKQSDSKIYAGHTEATPTFGATGVAVTTGVWYRIDVKLISTANPWTIDVQVDGVACGQTTKAVAAADLGSLVLGNQANNETYDAFYEDTLLSVTSGDYPLGDGYVLSYVPNADGDGASANRHNGLAANEVERTLTGTDIVNTTTDAFQLVDDRPLESAAGDWINWKTNGTAGDYVELAYENSLENVAPRSVEAIVGYHDAGGSGTHNFSLTLRDSTGGTTADVMPAATRNVGATMSWGRAHFATIPGTASAWTLTAFNALRSRWLVTDASPDAYLDGLMLEAEYPGIATITAAIRKVAANINTDQSASGFAAEIDASLRKVTSSLNAEQRNLLTVNATLVKTAASINVYMRPEVEIDSTVAKVVASLLASHQQRVTVGATLRPVAASINVQQEQRVTVASTLTKVASSVNVVMVPDARITSTLVKTAANLNLAQQVTLTIDSDLAKVRASLNAYLRPEFTIVSMLRPAQASLNAEQRYLVVQTTAIQEVAASINVAQRQLLSIAATLVKVAANLNVNISVSPELHITSTLAKVTASLNAEQRQQLSIASTLENLTASLNAYMRPDFQITTSLRKVTASLSAEQRHLITVASTLAELSASLNTLQRQLVTVASSLAKVRASVNVDQAGVPEMHLSATLAEVAASLTASQRDLLTIDSDLRPLAANVNTEKRYLIAVASSLAKLSANVNLSQSQRMTVATVLAHLTSDLHLNQTETYAMRINSELVNVASALSVFFNSGAINSTLANMEFSSRLLRLLSRIALTGRSSHSIARVGNASGDIGLVGDSDEEITLLGNQSAGIALLGRRE